MIFFICQNVKIIFLKIWMFRLERYCIFDIHLFARIFKVGCRFNCWYRVFVRAIVIIINISLLQQHLIFFNASKPQRGDNNIIILLFLFIICLIIDVKIFRPHRTKSVVIITLCTQICINSFNIAILT